MYQCTIEYTGNGNFTQQAKLNGFTINGNTYTSSIILANFTLLETTINTTLDAEGIAILNVIVSMDNSGNIAANTGNIVVYVTIFYPSTELIDMSLDLSINGVNESILLEKLPTA